MRIILASKSQARQKAMQLLKVPFEVISSDFDEKSLRHDDPYVLAEKLAIEKAKALSNQENALVIAADMFCIYNNTIYEKPSDLIDASRMLHELSGQTFEIVSGICVLNTKTNELKSCLDKSQVRFRDLTDFEINKYIEDFPVLDYSAAFDGTGIVRFSEHVQGPYIFDTGMSMDKVITYLREFGYKI